MVHWQQICAGKEDLDMKAFTEHSKKLCISYHKDLTTIEVDLLVYFYLFLNLQQGRLRIFTIGRFFERIGRTSKNIT